MLHYIMDLEVESWQVDKFILQVVFISLFYSFIHLSSNLEDKLVVYQPSSD